MQRLRRLWDKSVRNVVGLMSGTSLDGVDAVLARLEGSGRDLQVEVLAFVNLPYEEDLRELLLANSAPNTSSVLDVAQLNVRVAREYERAILQVAAEAGLTTADIDLVGSHGQTLHHVPERLPCAGDDVTSTLQVGDPSALANWLEVPVVGDFRTADMALGGQGAPLVPYFDYVYFLSDEESRGLLNVGGIANITVLPAAAELNDVVAFDTGPGNMVIDALTALFYEERYDASGRYAAGGDFSEDLMAELLRDPYFTQEPPKSTGREYFGQAYAERLVRRCKEVMGNPKPDDVLATASMLTVLSVYQAYARFIRPHQELDVLIVSGGGMHNEFLMERLTNTFTPIRVRPVSDYGIDTDAKEALCFAVLAHETINGVPTNLPTVTGASRPALLGKICIP